MSITTTQTTWLNGQPDDFLMCRDTGIRHPWQPYDVQVVGGRRGGFVERLKCDRCGSVKIRTLDGRGNPVKTHIDYVEGFLRAGMGRMTAKQNALVRVEHLTRRLGAEQQVS